MGKHYSNEFKEEVLNTYKSGKFGGVDKVSKKYGLSFSTVMNWIIKDRKQGNQINDIEHKRGRPKEENINYKENVFAGLEGQRKKKKFPQLKNT